MTNLKLYNTLTRKKETFKPIDVKGKEVKMYSCGPTVYWFQHIGNLRTYIFSDVLRRVLEFNGYKVKHVINVTDVGHLTSDADEGEDKMEKAAAREGKKASDIADYYFKIFREDLKKLNILTPTKWTKATEHIKEQIELIKKLEKKGFTYTTSDGIYFDSSKFDKYGELIHSGGLKKGLKAGLEKGLRAGFRVSMGEKKNKTDFALWKFSPEEGKRQQEWKSPWGVGFPGWHIECSAMSMKYLGEHFDIHTGGEDHIPVHHTNEIAQSEAATGKKFVNFWMHGAFLNFKGEKVSKSKGGLYTISELEEFGYSALDYRYLCYQTNYRKQLDFSLDALDAAKKAFERLKRKIIEIKKEKSDKVNASAFINQGNDLSEKYSREFLEAVNDDLNMPRALQVVWIMFDDFDFSPAKKLKLLERFDDVLAFGISKMKEEKVKIPVSIKKLIEEREKLRKEKKWAEADIVRERIREEGFEVEDTKDGARVRRV